MTDLLSEAVGGRVVACNDEFFAKADNLIKVADPIWKEGVYDDHGKWMDGWETRRRREPGHDWCVLALGIQGRVESVVIDTSYFTGNYPERFSLEGCGVSSDDQLEGAEWFDLVAVTGLEGDARATHRVGVGSRVTYLRLNIFPDGGVARLRVEGTPIPAMQDVCPEDLVDLASLTLGGEALDASDFHYNPPSKMLSPTDPAGMWDGWETARRRGSGHDWATLRLGMPGTVERIDADTSFFKGNSPGWVSVELSENGETWDMVIDHVPVEPDSVNRLTLGTPAHAAYARLSIHPDGGMARLRLWGRADRDAAGIKRIEYLNSLSEQAVRGFFRTACASQKWVERMMALRPFADVAAVLDEASGSFSLLEEDDWLEAFSGHPRIGEQGDATSVREQSGVTRSSAGDLEAVNRSYEAKFGFTYIVYATGKTGEEMLSIARSRLDNSRDAEIANGAAEQRKITATRLRRMLCQEAG